jgi:hypothetical protein
MQATRRAKMAVDRTPGWEFRITIWAKEPNTEHAAVLSIRGTVSSVTVS